MSRTIGYLILAALAFVGASAYGAMQGEAVVAPLAGGGLAGPVVSGPSVPDPGVPGAGVPLPGSGPHVAPGEELHGAAPAPDTARDEIDRGRFWHASRILERRLRERGTAPPEDLLLLARAHAGWANWEGVRNLLEEADWLDRVGGGEGWRLLGLAREELGEAPGAAEAYGRYLGGAGDVPDSIALPTRIRRARMLARAERWDEVSVAIGELEAAGAEELAGWTALAAARFAASRGRPDEVQALLAGAGEERRVRASELRATALLAAGDTASARDGFVAALEDPALTGARRAEVWTTLGELRMLQGDREAARDAFRASLEERSSGGSAVRAARGLLDLDESDAGVLRTAADALASGGESGDALRAWDRYIERVGTPEPEARLARALLLARAPGRAGEAVDELRALSSPDAPAEIGAPALAAWASLRGRQGTSGDRRTLLDRLVDRYPASAEAVNVAFLRADALHDEGRRDAALEGYRSTMEMNPGLDRAGLARMRAGQMLLHAGEAEAAARVFEEYLERYPDGRRWQQATFWAATARREAGDPDRAGELFGDLRERDPLDYYALLASRELGVDFPPDLPAGEALGEPPAWMQSDLTLLDRLDASGLEEGAGVVEARLRERAGTPSEKLLLANAFHRRGRTIPGINLGWEVRRAGRAWDRRLVEVVYPLPYREQLRAEAAEWGVDPYLMAAIARRESAWVEDITSPAGARGLMQVMPETGRQLARRVGPEDYHPRILWTAEVSLHLGAAYLADVFQRYDGALPLVLSSYNAGPHRADVWRDFPEWEDPLRFIERIPFGETREYVRQVTRNRAIYEWLYPGLDAAAGPAVDDTGEPGGGG